MQEFFVHVPQPPSVVVTRGNMLEQIANEFNYKTSRYFALLQRIETFNILQVFKVKQATSKFGCELLIFKFKY